MDEKTQELRDIFVDLTDEETVTERQEQGRGSLADERRENERLESVITRMRKRYGFETAFGIEERCRIVREFYEESTDEEIAEGLDVEESAVFRARMELHLLREEDLDAEFDLSEFRRMLIAGATTAELAESFGIEEATARRYQEVVAAEDESRRANDRFRDEFEEILTDGDLSARLAREVREDGLEDATEGMESNVSF